MKKITFDAIGTSWIIDIYDSVSDELVTEINQKIQDYIKVFDKNYSRFRDDSLVLEMSKNIGEYVLPTDSKPMMDFYEKLYSLTEGKFTPLIGDTLVQAGYDANYSLVPKKVHSPDSWNDAIQYSYPKIIIKKPVLLDFGGLGKGYLIDQISSIISEHKVTSFVVDGGGDIYTKNRELVVGLENPQDLKQVIGKVIINNQSICASSGNRRAWDKYHHIINPHSLESPKHILGTWVIANKALLSDGIATSLFLSDEVKLKSSFDFEYLILFADGSTKKSVGFKVELFIN